MPEPHSLRRHPHRARKAGGESRLQGLQGDLIAAENAGLSRLFEAGTIAAATRRRLKRRLDPKIARLTEEQQ